jgi:hypothetical protein
MRAGIRPGPSHPSAPPDAFGELWFEVRAADGGLRARSDDDTELTLAFYRDDSVLATDQDGQTQRADFVRGPDGRIAWFRERGRLFAHQDGAAGAR